MQPEAFARYRAHAVDDYAGARMRSGDTPEFARQRANEDYDALLPTGLLSPGQHLYSILAPGSDEPVGMVWFAFPGRDGPASAYVYDLAIDAACRRHGYAQAAMAQVERLAAAMGARRISLNVMGWNTAAKALYDKCGFQVVGIGMSKPIG